VFECRLNAALSCALSSLRPVRLHGKLLKILMPAKNVLFWHIKFGTSSTKMVYIPCINIVNR